MSALLFILIFFPMLAAGVSFVIGRFGKTARSVFAAVVCAAMLAVSLILFISGRDLSVSVSGVLTGGLSLTLDGFRRLYILVISFAWTVAAVFSLQYFAEHYRSRNRYYSFFLLTLGAVMGVFLASDLMTSFVFFEITSFTSFVWVIHDQTEESITAAKTYLYIAVIGGLVLFMGLLLLWRTLGTLRIDGLREAAQSLSDRRPLYPAGICILIGFGAKAGIFPLHIWLPKAHPVAPAPASALLSGILTKVGIFGVVALSAGAFYGDVKWGVLLLVLGVITMALGGVMALFSVNLKRTIACSSVSQIGFIAVGIASASILGEHNSLAVTGTVLHMLNHSLFKLSLFTAAGVVYMNLHKLDLNDVRGFGRGKPLLFAAFLIGALGIGGIPLFSGYISKTLLHEGLLECAEFVSAGWIKCAEWLFLFSGGCTLAYMTKLFVVLFIEKHPERQAEFDAMRPCVNGASAAVIAISSAAILVLGVPSIAIRLASGAVGFLGGTKAGTAEFFSFEALKGAAICIVIAAVLYFALIRKATYRNGRYVDIIPSWMDLENSVYKPLINALTVIGEVFGRVVSGSADFVALAMRRSVLSSTVGHILSGATDTAAYMMRRTVLSSSVGRILSGSTDLAAYSARRSLLSPTAIRVVSRTTDQETFDSRDQQFKTSRIRKMHAGSVFTDALGHLLDRITHSQRFVLYFAKVRRLTYEMLRRISESFSFALIMTCIGVCVLLVYLLLK